MLPLPTPSRYRSRCQDAQAGSVGGWHNVKRLVYWALILVTMRCNSCQKHLILIPFSARGNMRLRTPSNIMVLQRPKRHEMSQHNICIAYPSAHSTGSRTHEPNSCQSTTFLTHSTTTIAKAYSCMHYSRCTAS